MNIDELKKVELETLELDKVEQHQKDVLQLNESEAIEYLEYALDTFYKTPEEGENSESVEKFFESEDFRSLYTKIANNANEVEESAE